MLSTIPLDRLFTIPNPQQDFIEKRSELVLNDQYPDRSLLSFIINANLTATEPSIYSLGKIHQIILPPLSKWQACTCTMRQIGKDKGFWKTITLVVIGVAIAIFAIVVGLDQYVGAVTFLLIGTSFLIGGATGSLVQKAHMVYHRIPKDLAYVQTLIKTTPSTMALATDRNKKLESIVDIISQESLSIQEIQRPNKLAIGQYVTDILSMVRATLKKPCLRQGRLPHPFENRAMTKKERSKFLKDTAHFFSVSIEYIQDCWVTEVPIRIIQKALQGHLHHTYDQMKTELEELARYTKFLELLPSSIKKNHCGDWRALPPSLLF